MGDMATQAAGYATARKFMIDGQLRPNKVTDQAVIAAMARLPREIFAPPAARARAYGDEAVPLSAQQGTAQARRGMMAPMVLARLVQALQPALGNAAIVVGSGTGYAAAVLDDIGLSVTALEEEADLLAAARLAWPVALPGAAPTGVLGSLAQGHAAGAPYDVILIDGAVAELPPALVAQLADGGCLAMVRSAPGQVPVAVLGRKLGGGFFLEPIMDATAPMLPGFAPAPSFVF